jgi:hypothetical protein
VIGASPLGVAPSALARRRSTIASTTALGLPLDHPRRFEAKFLKSPLGRSTRNVRDSFPGNFARLVTFVCPAPAQPPNPNLDDETTYFFTVTAYTTGALESQMSNEISFKTPPLGAHTLTVNNGTGSGKYTESTRLTVSAKRPAEGQEFDRWIGDWQILDNPFEPTTTALMLFRDLTITPSYRASGTFANESSAGIDTASLAGAP